MRAVAFACLAAPSLALADVPKVVTDIAPVHSIVAAVMEGVGEPSLLVPPTASPHGYSLRPSEAGALDEAQSVIWIGEALTPWMEGPIDALAEDAALLTLLEVPGVNLLDIREGAAFEAGHDHDHGDDHGDEHEAAAEKDHDHDHDHGEEHADGDKHDHDDHAHDEHAHDDHGHKEAAHDDHDHGEEHAHKDDDDHAHDDHGHEDHAGHDHDDHAHADGIDAHAWLDPRNAAVWADAIAAHLSALDPENAASYASNADSFKADLGALEAELTTTLLPARGKPFVVFHDAYQYFEDRFGVEAVGAISATDAASASAGRVAEVRARVSELGAVCALTEPQFNPGIADAIGAAALGEIDPLGAKIDLGSDLYAQLLRNMAQSLVDCVS